MSNTNQTSPAELVGLLAHVDPSTLDRDQLIESLAEWERIAGWVHAMQNEHYAALAAALEAIDAFDADLESGDLDELALRLGLHRGTVATRLSEAITLTETLPHIHAALWSGTITIGHARAATRGVSHVPDGVATAVDQRVMSDSESWHTPKQLGRAVAAAVATLDPEGAEQRRRDSVKDRDVRFRPEPDGMASMWALLAAEDARAMAARVDAHALSSATHPDCANDHRTLAQRRADALVEFVLDQRRSQLVGNGDALASDVVGDGVSRENSAGSNDRPDAPTAARRDPRVHGRQPHIGVTVSWTTLIGLDDAPAELDGYGPIDAVTARRIAADPTATWRRLLTEPASGRLLDIGRTRYRPPADLVDFVLTRDLTCRFPTCDRPATVCEIDHRAAWADGGTTAAHNLDVLCRTHHALKHRDGWTHTRSPDTDVSSWTTPRERVVMKKPEVRPVERDLGPPPF